MGMTTEQRKRLRVFDDELSLLNKQRRCLEKEIKRVKTERQLTKESFVGGNIHGIKTRTI